LKLTIDSTEALEDTLRVIGAFYNVTLEVSPDGATGNRSGSRSGDGVATSARPTRGTRRNARRTPAKSTPRKRTSNKQTRTGRARASTAAGQVSTAAIRTWAREHGYTVADRGRVPAEVVAAYRNAQPA
jgi:hypothetical protein